MSNESDSEDNENDLFRAEMSRVRKLDQDTVAPWRQSRAPRPKQRELDDKQVIQDMLSDPTQLDLEHADLETGDELLFNRPGVQNNLMRKLRRGQFSLEAELDLHRMTSNQARQALVVFLKNCAQSGKRCVRIIHGKGHGSFNKLPVLKHKLNHWLRQRDDVLAFCSARPVDGGTGAVYVLLRRLK